MAKWQVWGYAQCLCANHLCRLKQTAPAILVSQSTNLPAQTILTTHHAATAVSGNVATQDRSTLRRIGQLSVFALAPTPAMEPTDTWVVETGKPNLLANSTSIAVIRFAANPCV